MISVNELEKMRDYVLKQVTKENRCLVLGTEELIDNFCKDTGTRIDYIMTDSLTIDNEVESSPAKIYNPKTKEIFLLSLTDKDYLIKIMTHSRELEKQQECCQGEDIKEDLRYLLGVYLVKNGRMKSADMMCADSEEEKIDMVNKIFRRPPKRILDEMKVLSKNPDIIETDKRFDMSVKQYPKIAETYANERLCESIGISDNRFEELRQILLKLSKLSIHSGNMDDIMDIDINKYLDLLEKEEGINHRERLYLAFSEGSILQQCAIQFNEKFPSLEEDRDERLKSIGKRYSCEISKTLTISKIDNLKLNLMEKLKCLLWAGIHNQRFYYSKCDLEKEE